MPCSRTGVRRKKDVPVEGVVVEAEAGVRSERAWVWARVGTRLSGWGRRFARGLAVGEGEGEMGKGAGEWGRR